MFKEGAVAQLIERLLSTHDAGVRSPGPHELGGGALCLQHVEAEAGGSVQDHF